MPNPYVSTVRATNNIHYYEEIMMTMKHNLRNLILVAVAVLFSATAFVASGAFGNPQQQNRQLTVASPTVSAKLSEGAANVRTIQSVLNRVEKAKYLKEQDAKELETAMSATAEALYAAFNKATSEAEEAGKSEGKTGSVGSLKAFESGVTVQLASINQIEARLRAIQRSVENKSYKIDRSLEQSFNQTEQEQIREARPRVTYVGRFSNSFAEVSSGGSNLTSAAMPKLVAPCVSPCWNKQWSACVSCILSKVPSAIGSYNTFVSCWNGAKAPWKAVKQAACLARFIAVLA